MADAHRSTFPGPPGEEEDPVAREREDRKASFEPESPQHAFQEASGNVHPVQGPGKVSAVPSQTASKWYAFSAVRCWEPGKKTICLCHTGLGVLAIFLLKSFLLNPFSHKETTRSLLNGRGHKNIKNKEEISQ